MNECASRANMNESALEQTRTRMKANKSKIKRQGMINFAREVFFLFKLGKQLNSFIIVQSVRGRCVKQF